MEKECIPLYKIKKNNKLYIKSKSKSQRCVLLCTGSYNPVHHMHIKIFNIVKKRLEDVYGYVVIGGFVSPSHSLYVNRKLGNMALKGSTRVKLCKMATDNSKWIDTSSYEASFKRPMGFSHVLSIHKKYIDKNVKKPGIIKYFYICGGDLFEKCGLGFYRPCSIVVVGRNDCIERGQKELKSHVQYASLVEKQQIERLEKEHPMIIIEDYDDSKDGDFSSTKVRECLEEKDLEKCLTIVKEEVYEYLVEIGYPGKCCSDTNDDIVAIKEHFDSVEKKWYQKKMWKKK